MLRIPKLASGSPRSPILVCQCWEPWYLKVAPLSWTVTPLSQKPQCPGPSAWLWVVAAAAGHEGDKARLGHHRLPPSLRRHPGSQHGDSLPLAAQVGLLQFREGRGWPQVTQQLGTEPWLASRAPLWSVLCDHSPLLPGKGSELHFRNWKVG